MKEIKTIQIVTALLVISTLYTVSHSAEKNERVNGLTGPQLWEKIIGYHDPDGVWENFKGKVHLVTTYRRDRLFEEVIELDNSRDFYQVKRKNRIESVSGVDKGKAFAWAEKTIYEPEEQKRLLTNARDGAAGSREHHSGHIGMPMKMKDAGLVAEQSVYRVKFLGSDCYAFDLVGKAEKVTNDYWTGDWTVYVDPDTFKLRGVLNDHPDYPARYFECLGEFEVGGIKVQQVKNFYSGEDGAHVFTDVYAKAPE